MPRGRAYRFVETSLGQSSSSREFQQTVRSHAASVSRPDRTVRRQARTRARNGGEGVIVFEVDPTHQTTENHPEILPTTTQGDITITSRRPALAVDHQSFNSSRLSMDNLSGNTFSPLQQLATYHKPYLPGIVDHYICNLTIPVPELDGNSAVPLFRAAWLPVVFHDPVVFQVVILFAATHYATFADPGQFDQLYFELLSLKQSALSALIQTVQNEQTRPPTSTNRGRDSRDTLIAAAAKMASYEAIFGAKEAFHLHMSTVTRLLRSQGGLNTLGMNGFLSRLLSFIDTNSAFLLGTNPYLVEFGLLNVMPHHRPFSLLRLGEAASDPQIRARNSNAVNLERFVGFINVRT